MKNFAATLALCASAVPALAHPHIFVDTGLDLFFDSSGHLSEVRITWRYDAFYSLLVTQDMGLDTDGDGVLTSEENANLQGFDMNWSAGFAGDLELTADAQPVVLSGPRNETAALVLGRITTTHVRDVLSPVTASQFLQMRPFDPTYYTAYEMAFPVTIQGMDGCDAAVDVPQQSAFLTALQQELSALGVDTDPSDIGLGNIGAVLATTVNVTCAGS